MPLSNETGEIQGVIWSKRDISVFFSGASSTENVKKGDSDSFVDLWLAERHTLKISKSKYPVQSGFVISDTAYVEPRKLSLTGYIANVKALPLTDGRLGVFNNQQIKSGWAILEKSARNLRPLNVNTNLGAFSNMLITGIRTLIDKTTGRNLKFVLDMEEIKIVTSQISKITVDKVAGSNNPAKNKTDKVVSGNVQSKSILFSLNKAITLGL